MRRTRVAYRMRIGSAASFALAIALGGCSHTVAVGPSRTLRLFLTEYRVIPQSVRSKAGQLTLLVENDGRLAHNLVVSHGGKTLGQTPPIQPGGSTYLVVVLRPGSYLIGSTLFSDQALGAYGTLTVVS